MRSLCKLAFATLVGVVQVHGDDGTIYMSVLSSRKHRINAANNPAVGLFVSTDRGDTWAHRGWREYIRVFDTEAGADGTIWSACGNGILRSTDGGRSWRVTTGWDVTEVLRVRVSPADPRTVYAATAYGIARSRDRGDHWRKVTKGFRRTFTSDVVIDRADPNHLFAASEQGLYESRNGGDSWSPGTFPHTMANVVVQHPVRAGEFWVGTEERGLFRSTDSGKSWHEASRGLLDSTVYCVAIDPSHPAHMYAGTYGGGVYRSDNGGLSWVRKSNGLGILDVHALLVVPGSPGVLLCGTLNGGLYRSTDRGDSWSFNSQEEAQVWGLSYSPAANGRGVH